MLGWLDIVGRGLVFGLLSRVVRVAVCIPVTLAKSVTPCELVVLQSLWVWGGFVPAITRMNRQVWPEDDPAPNRL